MTRKEAAPQPERPALKPWSLDDLAQMLDCSRRHLERLAVEGRLATFKVGARVYVAAAEARRVLESGC